MIITNVTKIRAVLRAYTQVIYQVYGMLIKTSVPKPGKHYANCLKFYEIAQESGASIHSLMTACLDSYPAWWCEKIFHRKYPPVRLLVSEKSRSQGLKHFPKTLQGSSDDAVRFYADQLVQFNEKIVSGLLANGFLPDAEMN